VRNEALKNTLCIHWFVLLNLTDQELCEHEYSVAL
jgi:hypothetical protein